MNKLRVVTLFSGYDSQCLGLDRLHKNYQFDYELIGWSEIDKYAIQAHNSIYPQYSERNLGDICKIDWNGVGDFDLMTYSSPCQDFSCAGLQKGGIKGSGTRSSLLWECERAIKEKRPKYLLMENVAALVSNKFIKLFNKWQHTLEEYGYTNYAKVLNAKSYGVPQNRERIFMISIRNDINQKFYFPEPFKLDKRLKDILEDNVEEKYYLSERIIKGFLEHNERHIAKGTGFLFHPKNEDEIAACIRSNSALNATDNTIYVQRIGNVNPSGNGMKGEIFNSNGISPTITTNKGEGNKILEPSILKKKRTEEQKKIRSIKKDKGIGFKEGCCLVPVNDGLSNCITSVQNDNLLYEPKMMQFKDNKLRIKQATLKGYIDVPPGGIFDASYPNSQTIRGRVQQNGEISPTIMSNGEPLNIFEGDFKIRKLTPKECFRLMDVSEINIDKLMNSGISNSQLYKLAGNSIVVSCLYHIFRKLFIESENENKQLELF